MPHYHYLADHSEQECRGIHEAAGSLTFVVAILTLERTRVRITRLDILHCDYKDFKWAGKEMFEGIDLSNLQHLVFSPRTEKVNDAAPDADPRNDFTRCLTKGGEAVAIIARKYSQSLQRLQVLGNGRETLLGFPSKKMVPLPYLRELPICGGGTRLSALANFVHQSKELRNWRCILTELPDPGSHSCALSSITQTGYI